MNVSCSRTERSDAGEAHDQSPPKYGTRIILQPLNLQSSRAITQFQISNNPNLEFCKLKCICKILRIPYISSQDVERELKSEIN